MATTIAALLTGSPFICAVVVTHNRRELLRECLTALADQTRTPDRVLVVDNAGTDGSDAMVRDEYRGVELLRLTTNEGGAGGFHEGLRAAHAGGADWAWLMDDDTVPTSTALAELLSAHDALEGFARPLLLASRVEWIDGRLHPMNEPSFKREPEPFVASCERGVIPLRMTTFVSLLVRRDAVERFGLPPKHFFIWSDDIEYTARIMREELTGFYVPASVVLHKTRTPHTAVTSTGSRFYFHVRNTLYMLRGRAWTPREKLSLLWALFFTTRGYLRHNEFAAENVRVVLRGLRDGVRPLRGAP